MTTILLAALVLVARHASATVIPDHSLDTTKRTNGFCKQLNIPIPVTAASAIYSLPKIDNDIEAGAWAIGWDTWSRPQNDALVIKNTTTSGTFNIHAQLCVPSSKSEHASTLQIATHGVHYDGRYWDPELKRDELSYVEATLKAGYSILTYDRLGVGQSDHPDAYDIVQAPLELEILHQLTLMARDGRLYKFAESVKPLITPFNALLAPKKVVHIGHSFGSFITSAFLAKHSNLTDGGIITGFLINQYLGKPGMVSFGVDYAATATPAYERGSGYVVCSKRGIQNIFFAGNVSTAYTSEMFEYGNAIKQPVPIGEFASAYHIIGLPGPKLTAPVQYFLAEQDFYICGGDCKGIAKMEVLRKTFPNAKDIDVYVHPNTGHAFTLHNNATAGYQVIFDFLAKHAL
jgi:pimeloyl-ACP methyl ester carboxylesterase